MIINEAAVADLISPDGYITAGETEELISAPAFRAVISIKGEGNVYANGTRLKPAKKYADGTALYEYALAVVTPIGKQPGLTSLRITPGAKYKSRIVGIQSVTNYMRNIR